MPEQQKRQVIMPPNKLRDKVPSSGGPDLDAIVKEAEVALGELADISRSEVVGDVKRMHDTFLRASATPGEAAAALAEIRVMAHDIKGYAPNLKLDLLAAVAAALEEFLRERAAFAAGRLDLVKAHVDALRAIANQGITGDGGALGREMLNDLATAVKRAT